MPAFDPLLTIRDREEWFLVALLVVTVVIMIGLTIWPCIGGGHMCDEI